MTIPVTDVVSVIAGVVVGVATDHAKPLAVTTLAVVTVPPPAGVMYFNPRASVESATSINQSAPTGRRVFIVPNASKSPFVVKGALLVSL